MEVKCTQCGGGVPVGAGQGLASCPFCGASLYVDLNEAVGHFAMRPVLTESNIAQQLKTYLAAKERNSDFKVARASLVFWPYWVIQEEGGKTRSFIANAHPITAMEDAGVPAGEQEPFREDDYINGPWVQPPSGTVEEIIAREGLDAQKARLIHLPFWQVNYNYDGIEYEAWGDAVRGEIYADDLPPTFAKEKDKLYLKVVAIIALIYLAIGLISPSGHLATLIMLAVSAPIYLYLRVMMAERAA